MICNEVGITYTHDEPEKEYRLSQMIDYTLIHLPTGRRFKRRVWVARGANYLKLLMRWNWALDWKVVG